MKIGIATGINCKPICWNENSIITTANEKKNNFQNILGPERICSIKV
jgi:hypothetical protein